MAVNDSKIKSSRRKFETSLYLDLVESDEDANGQAGATAAATTAVSRKSYEPRRGKGHTAKQESGHSLSDTETISRISLDSQLVKSETAQATPMAKKIAPPTPSILQKRRLTSFPSLPNLKWTASQKRTSTADSLSAAVPLVAPPTTLGARTDRSSMKDGVEPPIVSQRRRSVSRTSVGAHLMDWLNRADQDVPAVPAIIRRSSNDELAVLDDLGSSSESSMPKTPTDEICGGSILVAHRSPGSGNSVNRMNRQKVSTASLRSVPISFRNDDGTITYSTARPKADGKDKSFLPTLNVVQPPAEYFEPDGREHARKVAQGKGSSGEEKPAGPSSRSGPAVGPRGSANHMRTSSSNTAQDETSTRQGTNHQRRATDGNHSRKSSDTRDVLSGMRTQLRKSKALPHSGSEADEEVLPQKSRLSNKARSQSFVAPRRTESGSGHSIAGSEGLFPTADELEQMPRPSSAGSDTSRRGSIFGKFKKDKKFTQEQKAYQSLVKEGSGSEAHEAHARSSGNGSMPATPAKSTKSLKGASGRLHLPGMKTFMGDKNGDSNSGGSSSSRHRDLRSSPDLRSVSDGASEATSEGPANTRDVRPVLARASLPDLKQSDKPTPRRNDAQTPKRRMSSRNALDSVHASLHPGQPLPTVSTSGSDGAPKDLPNSSILPRSNNVGTGLVPSNSVRSIESLESTTSTLPDPYALAFDDEGTRLRELPKPTKHRALPAVPSNKSHSSSAPKADATSISQSTSDSATAPGYSSYVTAALSEPFNLLYRLGGHLSGALGRKTNLSAFDRVLESDAAAPLMAEIITRLNYMQCRRFLLEVSPQIWQASRSSSVVESVLERVLSQEDYRRPSKKKQSSALTLLDLSGYLASKHFAPVDLAKFAARQLKGGKDDQSKMQTLKIRESLRGGNRVVAALSRQNQSSFRKCGLYRVWVPSVRGSPAVNGVGHMSELAYTAGKTHVATVGGGGPCMTDQEVGLCENELSRCGDDLLDHLRRGDVVWNVAVTPLGNRGKLLWDGKYLRDLSYAFSSLGHLPAWIDAFSFPPSYYHQVIMSPTAASPNEVPQSDRSGDPIVWLDLRPWAADAAQSLHLQREFVEVPSSDSNLKFAKSIYRSSIYVGYGVVPEVKQSLTPGKTSQEIDRTRAYAQKALQAEPWGEVILEAEGTGDAARDLIERVAGSHHLLVSALPKKYSQALKPGEILTVPTSPWRIIRAMSSPGRIWLRPVLESERVNYRIPELDYKTRQVDSQPARTSYQPLRSSNLAHQHGSSSGSRPAVATGSATPRRRPHQMQSRRG